MPLQGPRLPCTYTRAEAIKLVQSAIPIHEDIDATSEPIVDTACSSRSCTHTSQVGELSTTHSAAIPGASSAADDTASKDADATITNSEAMSSSASVDKANVKNYVGPLIKVFVCAPLIQWSEKTG